MHTLIMIMMIVGNAHIYYDNDDKKNKTMHCTWQLGWSSSYKRLITHAVEMEVDSVLVFSFNQILCCCKCYRILSISTPGVLFFRGPLYMAYYSSGVQFESGILFFRGLMPAI